MQTQTVSVSACNLVSNFTHTVLSNGSVHFSNTSAITSSSTLFKWDFGDGIYSLASNPSHVYSNAGTYYVTLQVRDSLKSYCRDTLTQSINVTGIPCVANSNFTVTPTSTPQYWNAVPSYPWNVTAATWFWGDGTQSNLLYTSHVYSVASTYSICLSVTVSCGASSSYCFPYYINKSNNASSQIVNINVLPPEKGNGIVNLNTDDFLHEIYPNPNTGSFNIHLEGTDKETTITVYNLVGESVYRVKLQSDEGNTTLVNLENAAKGIYFVSLVSGNRSFTQKIIIGD